MIYNAVFWLVSWYVLLCSDWSVEKFALFWFVNTCEINKNSDDSIKDLKIIMTVEKDRNEVLVEDLKQTKISFIILRCWTYKYEESCLNPKTAKQVYKESIKMTFAKLERWYVSGLHLQVFPQIFYWEFPKNHNVVYEDEE